MWSATTTKLGSRAQHLYDESYHGAEGFDDESHVAYFQMGRAVKKGTVIDMYNCRQMYKCNTEVLKGSTEMPPLNCSDRIRTQFTIFLS